MSKYNPDAMQVNGIFLAVFKALKTLHLIVQQRTSKNSLFRNTLSSFYRDYFFGRKKFRSKLTDTDTQKSEQTKPKLSACLDTTRGKWVNMF